MFSLTPWKKKNGSLAPMRSDRDDFFPLSRLRDEFEAMWDRFWKEWDRGWTGGSSGAAHWRTNWTESDSDYLFQVELPGFAADDLDVKVAGNVLTVHAEHKEEQKHDQGGSYRYGAYHQSFPVPQGVAADQIEANYRNGMLEVRLPKSEHGRGRRITVQPS